MRLVERGLLPAVRIRHSRLILRTQPRSFSITPHSKTQNKTKRKNSTTPLRINPTITVGPTALARSRGPAQHAKKKKKSAGHHRAARDQADGHLRPQLLRDPEGQRRLPRPRRPGQQEGSPGHFLGLDEVHHDARGLQKGHVLR